MILFTKNYCKSTWYLKNWLPYDLERIRLQLEKLRTQLRQQANWVNPSEIENPKLKNIIDNLYIPNAKIGSGSTADAVRVELRIDNLKVGGKSHKIKAENSVRSITDMLNNDYLSAHDRMVAENVRLDLLDSLGEKHGIRKQIHQNFN